MSKGNVDKFLELMQTDEGLARKMAACLYMLENGGGKAEGSGGFIAREIVPLAKEYGLEFTAQDFLDYTEEAKTKVGLSDDDLAEVSGGKGGVRAALMGTLALLGVAAAPAAMEMASGGEVSQFSMVASAETPKEEKSEQATPEQLEELQLGIVALKSLKGTISSSKLTQEEKNTLEKSRADILKTAKEAFNSKAKADVEQEKNKIKDYLKEIKRNSLTNNWFTERNRFLGLSARIKKLEGKTLLNQQEIVKLRNTANTLKKNLIGHTKEHGKGKKATGTNANDFEAKIKSFEDILARAEELNKNKEQLVQILHNIKSLLNYNEGKKIVKQIAALNDEIKDFTPENIEKKEADFNAIYLLSKGIIDVHNLQKRVNDLLKTKGANQNILNDIKGALDIAARDLTKENAADISKVLAEIKEKLKAEKENIKKIKSESKEKKEQKKKDQEKKYKKAAEYHNVAVILSTLQKQKTCLDEMEQPSSTYTPIRTDSDIEAKKNAITKLRERINNFGAVNSENIREKYHEIIDIRKAIDDLINAHNKFMHEHMLFPENKNKVKTLLACFKKLCNDKDQLDKINELEQELDTMEKTPDDSSDLFAALTRLNNIKNSIPQIKAMLNKATTLKKIAEQVNADLAEIFDNIIKEIEAADSVEKVNSAAMKLDNSEKTLRGLMRTEINEAKGLYHVATKLGVRKLEGDTLRLIEDASGIDSLEEGSIDKIKQLSAGLNKIGQDIKNYLGEQIDSLVAQANELKDQANGVDAQLYSDFNDMATNLAADKDELLKDLRHAAQTIFNVRESLAERQGKLLSKLALKNQIDTMKAQATRLKDMATGVDDYLMNVFDGLSKSLDNIRIDGNLQQITADFNQIKNLVNERAKDLDAPKLVKALEIDALLENEVMGAEIQDELKAIKAGLPKADEANSDTVVKAFDDVKAVKTKMANKLLDLHKILSEYHKKGYYKEGKKDVVEINLNVLAERANQMLNGADGIKLDAETLNTATALAKEIADNLNTDIAGIMDNVKSYNGFGEFDFTAGTQANTLATFLKDKFIIVDDLKFVDKQTRAKLAKDIKHIFDQIKIDQKTGKYYLPGFYNWYAVNHDDLKLICEAYGVVADDFGARPGYKSFKHLGATELSAKDKAEALIGALANVQRLDLLDVSPESREALKNDILEIGAKIKSTPGWIYGRTLSLEGVDQKETKNMQEGLAKILEFYNSIQAQMNVKK